MQILKMKIGKDMLSQEKKIPCSKKGQIFWPMLKLLKTRFTNLAPIVIMIPNLTTSIKNWLQDFPETVVEIRLKGQILMEEIKVCY